MTIQSLDAQLLLFFNRTIANPLFDALMPALSAQGYLLVLPFLIYLIAQGITRKNETGRSFLTTAIGAIVIACCAIYCADLLEHAMKDLVARVRPCRAVDTIRLIIPCPKSFSMPSGHATSSFACAVPLWYLTREYSAAAWRLYPVALAAMIAFSRLYLGVHYPTDVLVGGMLGSAIGLGLSISYQLMNAKSILKQKK